MRLHGPLCLALPCAIIMLGACAHPEEPRFATGASDLEGFILREATVRGGRPIRTNELPRIDAMWRFSRDGDGVVIRMRSGASGPSLKFLREAFGVPHINSTNTGDGVELVVFRLSDEGGYVTFGRDRKNTEIIIVGSISDKATARGLTEGLP